MKLSQMTSDLAADVMIQIAPDIEGLVNDTGFSKLFTDRKKTTDKNEATKLGGVLMLKVATYLLKEHRQSVWNILGALQQKTADEIGKQFITITIKQIVDVLGDEEFMSFFQLSEKSEPET